MAKQTKKTGEAKAPARGRKAEVAAAGKRETANTEAARPVRGRTGSSARRKEPESAVAKVSRSARPAVETVKARVPEARRTTTRAAKSVARKAADLVPEAPSLPIPELGEFAKNVGGQLLGALNTDVGRVMVAELLIYLAKSLTKAAASTEAGQDAKDAVLNAGARIGAAAANAGAQLMDRGASAADAGADAASGVAVGAKDLAREVAQVAVGAVGGIVADVASKAIRGRGRGQPKAQQSQASTSTGPSAALSPASASSGTPRPRQL